MLLSRLTWIEIYLLASKWSTPIWIIPKWTNHVWTIYVWTIAIWTTYDVWIILGYKDIQTIAIWTTYGVWTIMDTRTFGLQGQLDYRPLDY